MGKIISRGSLQPDDPIFSGGVEMFSPLASKQSSTSTAKNTTGANSTSVRPEAQYPMQPAADLYEERMRALLSDPDEKDPGR